MITSNGKDFNVGDLNFFSQKLNGENLVQSVNEDCIYLEA